MGGYREMKIGKIENGTVIDHIPPELCFKIIRVLKLESHGKVVSAAVNLRSEKLEKKGMIKVGGKFLTEEEVSKISIVAPNVTMCIIKDYKVEKKIKLSLPSQINRIVRCNNPNCITNDASEKEKSIISYEDGVFRCDYCERDFQREDARLNTD